MKTIKTLKYEELDILLKGIQKPGRYINNEVGAIENRLERISDFSNIVLMALIFPDIYEVAMSNLGIQILYDIVNRRDDFILERVFSPWIDFERRLRERKVKLFSLESRIFLDSFDILGFSIQHEMLYTNVINLLNLGGLKIYAEKRKARFPVVCAGGPSTVNPQPLSRFMDFMVIGDGEEIIISILELLKVYKKNNKDKKWFLKEIAKIDGIYVGSFYKFYHFRDGRIKKFEPSKKVKKALVKDLNRFDIVKNPLIPNIKPVHDRFVVEIMRGCGRGCRFCQAGIIYRPVRMRDSHLLIEQSIKGLKNTGYDEVSFMSLSSSDYKDIEYLLENITKKCKNSKISISLPSLRIDSFNIRLAELIQSGRRTGLTFAPEAGSQRLRDIINKNIDEREMLECIGCAFRKGWKKIKLYFMIGLPFEEDEDIKEIVSLIKKIVDAAKTNLQKKKIFRFKINVSINSFCPKPFTPFQWSGQQSVPNLKRKIDYILKNVPKKFVKINWTSPEKSKIECALSRGDISVGGVIKRVWEKGSRFDNWTDFFDYNKWEEAFSEEGVDMEFFTKRNFNIDEILPWDMIDIGVGKQFLIKEFEKSKILYRKLK